MKILLTGYKGFIGQNLYNFLSENINCIIDTFEWGEPFKGVRGYDWVIHLGAISSTTEKNIDKILKQNTEFTNNLFDECKKYNVNFQFASSASLYGQNNCFKEDSELDPITPYAWSKLLSERYIINNLGTHNVHIFRYFNVYGNNEGHKKSQASPVTQFRYQSRVNNKIKLFYNSEKVYRDFICVTDVCRIHLEFIKKMPKSGIYNVGTGSTYSFKQIADLINPNHYYVERPNNLQRSYQNFTQSDNTKLMSVLGKQKYISIENFLENNS